MLGNKGQQLKFRFRSDSGPSEQLRVFVPPEGVALPRLCMQRAAPGGYTWPYTHNTSYRLCVSVRPHSDSSDNSQKTLKITLSRVNIVLQKRCFGCWADHFFFSGSQKISWTDFICWAPKWQVQCYTVQSAILQTLRAETSQPVNRPFQPLKTDLHSLSCSGFTWDFSPFNKTSACCVVWSTAAGGKCVCLELAQLQTSVEWFSICG